MLRERSIQASLLESTKRMGKSRSLVCFTCVFFQTIELFTQIALLRCSLRSEITFQINFLFRASSFSHYISYNFVDVGVGDRNQINLE